MAMINAGRKITLKLIKKTLAICILVNRKLTIG